MYARLHVEKWYTEHFEHLNIFLSYPLPGSGFRPWVSMVHKTVVVRVQEQLFLWCKNNGSYGTKTTVIRVQEQLFLWCNNNCSCIPSSLLDTLVHSWSTLLLLDNFFRFSVAPSSMRSAQRSTGIGRCNDNKWYYVSYLFHLSSKVYC